MMHVLKILGQTAYAYSMFEAICVPLQKNCKLQNLLMKTKALICYHLLQKVSNSC